MSEHRFNEGIAVRRQVMGEARIKASHKDADDIAFELQRLTTEFAWGEIWTREGLDRRSRSVRRWGCSSRSTGSAELKAHFVGAINNGLTHAELSEMVIHSAVYCGFPAALEAMRVLADVVSATDVDR